MTNLFIVGNLLAGGDYIQERSRDGVALATGYYLGNDYQVNQETQKSNVFNSRSLLEI